MTVYEVRVITATKIKTYIAEAKNLLEAKKIIEEKYMKENPTETIIRMELANPNKEKIGEIIELVKERV